ncbi:MAG: hypothetical protein KKE17_14280 [Proteobacteria bacterium]|nr:hypothetical protein [Pseudomonadota bacterium]MBU1711168.1 hypothetical protein [Pseudomonadota bacterium]
MNKQVVYINSDSLGQGDVELGKKLLVVYLETLLDFAGDISHILLINSGVKLACDGSEVLGIFEELSGMDIKILACGTCLNHFGIMKTLKSGTVSNMFTIIDVKTKSSRILMP